jgi:hypothetical protein
VSLVAAGLQAQATAGSAGLGAPVWIAAKAGTAGTK